MVGGNALVEDISGVGLIEMEGRRRVRVMNWRNAVGGRCRLGWHGTFDSRGGIVRVALRFGRRVREQQQRERDEGGYREQEQGQEASTPDAGGHHTDACQQSACRANNCTRGGVFAMSNINLIKRQPQRKRMGCRSRRGIRAVETRK